VTNMLKYYSGEIPEIGDVVADGIGTSWQGTVIQIHGLDHDPPFELFDGESIQIVAEALVINYNNQRDSVIEENPEEELILISRRK